LKANRQEVDKRGDGRAGGDKPTPLGRLTILLRIVCNPIQPSPRAMQPRRRPVHRRVRILQELVVQVQLGAYLDGEVVLPSDRVGEEIEAFVLV
jgi:hypothetical protein